MGKNRQTVKEARENKRNGLTSKRKWRQVVETAAIQKEDADLKIHKTLELAFKTLKNDKKSLKIMMRSVEASLKLLLDNENDKQFYVKMWKTVDIIRQEFWETMFDYIAAAYKPNFVDSKVDLSEDKPKIKTDVACIKNPGRVLFYVIEIIDVYDILPPVDDVLEKFLGRQKNNFNCYLWRRSWMPNILLELRTNPFVGVSTIIFIINHESEITDMRLELIEAMRKNPHLKYVTKLFPIFKYDSMRNPPTTKMLRYIFREDKCKLPNIHIFFIYFDVFDLWLHLMICRSHRCMQQMFRDLVTANRSVNAYELKKIPLRNRLKYLEKSVDLITTPVEMYLFHNNPCLMLCWNNFVFPESSVRKGNSKDVEKIMNIALSKRWPLFLINDATSSEMLNIMDCLKHADFQWVENLMVFVMSHGKDQDIIKTREGEFNLFDVVVQPLIENRSLANTKVFVFCVACRGSKITYRPRQNAMKQSSAALDQRTILPDNFCVLFSAPKGHVSLRSDDDGTYFVRAFEKVFSEPLENVSMADMKERIDREITTLLKQIDWPLHPTQMLQNPGVNHNLNTSTNLEVSLVQKPLDELENKLKRSLQKPRK